MDAGDPVSAEPPDDDPCATVNGGPKELAYDREVSPLVREIREVCTRHKINFLMFFALDELPGDQGILQSRTGRIADPEDIVGASTIAALHHVLMESTKPVRETN